MDELGTGGGHLKPTLAPDTSQGPPWEAESSPARLPVSGHPRGPRPARNPGTNRDLAVPRGIGRHRHDSRRRKPRWQVTLIVGTAPVVHRRPRSADTRGPSRASAPRRRNRTLRQVHADEVRRTMFATFSSPIWLLVAAVLAGPSACSGGPGEASPPESVASVTVDPAHGRLEPGETVQLDATARSESGADLSFRTVTWESLDPSIATVTRSRWDPALRRSRPPGRVSRDPLSSPSWAPSPR
jgi:hypothetical protein